MGKSQELWTAMLRRASRSVLLDPRRNALSTIATIALVIATAAGAPSAFPQRAEAGDYWTPQSLPSGTLVVGMTFIDAKHGWVMGYPFSFRTTDGGATWTEQQSDTSMYYKYGMPERGLPPGTYPVFPLQVSFINPLDGWGYGQYSPGGTGDPHHIVWRTTDGGAHWVQIYDFGAWEGMESSFGFVDAQHGWIAAGGPLGQMVTSDGGTTWSKRGNRTQMYLADATHGWASTSDELGDYNGRAMSTSDGGATWTEHVVSRQYSSLYVAPPRFFDSANGIAAGFFRVLGTAAFIATTKDGGKTWTETPRTNAKHRTPVGPFGPLGPGRGFGSLMLVGTHTAWGKGGNDDGTYWMRSTDRGLHWAAEPFDQASVVDAAGIAHIAFADALNGWAVSSDGSVLLHTVTGGTPTPVSVVLSAPAVQRLTYRNRPTRASCDMKPGDAVGDKSVVIKAYFYKDGAWTYHHTAKASRVSSNSSKYAASLKFPHRGSWRLRAYHPADLLHYARYSRYSYLKVR